MKTKVSLQEMKDNIATVRYINGSCIHGALRAKSNPMTTESIRNLARLTICIIELKNGFIVTGSNTCVDIDEWDEDLAYKYSYEDAFDKVAEVMSYAFMEQNHQQLQGS